MGFVSGIQKRKFLMKKGDVSSGFLLTLILSIAAFFILLGIINMFASKLPDESAKLLCKNTVVARANTALSVKTTGDVYVKMKTLPLLCKSYDVKISGTKKEVMQQLADLMAICWWQFAEGKYAYVIEDFFSGDTCFPCFTVIIKEIKGDTKIIEWTEFEDFLRTTNYTVKGISYYEYLTNYEDIPGSLIFFDNIEEKKVYNILYSDPKGGFSESKIPNGLYFADVNNPPEAWKKTLVNLGGKECKIITGVQGE